jgi:predicted DNA-binding protein
LQLILCKELIESQIQLVSDFNIGENVTNEFKRHVP